MRPAERRRVARAIVAARRYRGPSATKEAPSAGANGATSRPAMGDKCRAFSQLTPLRPGSGMRRRSACAGPLVEQEPDLHDDPELGDLVVLHHGLELLGPDGRDVADRAGSALDRFSDRVLIALRGLA